MLARLTAVIAIMLPAAAAAQDSKLPQQQAENELAGYADCVVRTSSNAKAVESFLKVIPDSPTFYPSALKAADMHCLDGAARRRGGKLEMRLQPATYRDALFPALYRARFGKAPPLDRLTAIAPLSYEGEFAGDTKTLSPLYRAGRGIGDCIARANPQASHALIMARPYTAAENAALQALRPNIAQCVTEGQTVSFSRGSLRAFIGEATYRLAVAASLPAVQAAPTTEPSRTAG